ncbi:hypothetical protein H5410_020273 [Solanum commersonii]|uniref:Uncharacterized protein n=1 Tax=Solanum commersonii TaxID=4109 RepID=A0A9J5ZAR1_SOLCO|nr:hypothetical protein H5410_020273 [Solanum commersonii]
MVKDGCLQFKDHHRFGGSLQFAARFQIETTIFASIRHGCGSDDGMELQDRQRALPRPKS